MDLERLAVYALSGFLSAIVIDLDAYVKAKKENPSKEFDWQLAAVRWIKGIIAGALAGAGLQAAG